MTKRIVIVVDAREYAFNADLDAMLKEAIEMKQCNPEDEGFGDYDKDQYDDMPTPTLEEYQANIDMMIQDIKDIIETPQVLEKVIKAMSTKKDGWLKKGSVGIYNRYTKTARYWEDSYCHVMYAIRGKASSDRDIDLYLESSEKYSW